MLRAYIEFAMHGPNALLNELVVPEVVYTESPFENEVYNFLTEKGYKLDTQVGCSGYRIDMAVKHPTLNGRYVLGVECDGATYHSARTARERDRLREDVLRQRGWILYRIWSTDWIKDPINEGQRLISAVEKAIEKYSEEEIIINTLMDDPVTSLQSLSLNEISELIEEDSFEDTLADVYGFTSYQVTKRIIQRVSALGFDPG